MDFINEIPYIAHHHPIDRMDFETGFYFPVDKPAEWTSFDVVNKLRYQLKRISGKKKIKVGHAGTLDPLATGLLLIACGPATKTIDRLTLEDKTYEGRIQLGATTPSFDAEMPVDQHYPIEHISQESILEVKDRFLGEIDQRPPLYSAIKKKGKPLYAYARADEEVDIPTRKIRIYHLELQWLDEGILAFSCTCSKGTYIRALARDLGFALQSGAYLLELRRTAIGKYPIGDAWPLDSLIRHLESN